MEYKKQIHGEEEEDDDDDEEEDENEEEIELPSSTSLGFNPLSSPLSLRGSAFSRPILSPSSSLISQRGRGGAAAGVAAGSAASSAKNVSLFGGSADPAAGERAAAPKDAAGGGKSRYRECLRNHAAASGGHVLDGCGEFMPVEGEEALKCAACGCHRSFHRKESEDAAAAADAYYRGAAAPLPLLLPPPPHHGRHGHKQFQFGAPATASSGGAGGTTTESSSEERINAGARPPTAQRKRFRTKFTAEQKEKMQAFAERIGWRIQKHDEAATERFFSEAGVSRHVFKVWMHNNKHLVKKPPPAPPSQHHQQKEEEDGEEEEEELDGQQHQLKLPPEQQQRRRRSP